MISAFAILKLQRAAILSTLIRVSSMLMLKLSLTVRVQEANKTSPGTKSAAGLEDIDKKTNTAIILLHNSLQDLYRVILHTEIL